MREETSAPFTIFGYGRASTAKQMMTTEVQAAEIDKAVKAYEIVGKLPPGTTYAGFFADEATTSKIGFMDRPAGRKIIESAKRGDMIIAAKFDRFFRSVLDLCRTMEVLGNRGIRLVILDADIDTSTVNGQGLLKILAVIKWMERETLRTRVKEAAAYRRENGLPVCAPPIGWKLAYKIHNGRKVSRIVPCPEERAIAKKVHDVWSTSKTIMYTGIELRKRGIKNPRNRKKSEYWTEASIAKWKDIYLKGFPLYEGVSEPCKFPPGSVPVELNGNRILDSILDIDDHEEVTS